MINILAVHLVDLLLDKKDNQKYDKEVYVYGTEVLISNMISLLSIIIISFFLSDVIIGAIFLLFFCPLRMFAGGYHASTYTKCFVIGNLSFIILYLINSFLWDRVSLHLIECLLLVMSLCILHNTPIINIRQEVNLQIQKRSRKLVAYLLVVYFILVVLLSFWNRKFMCMAFLSISLVTFFMMIVKKEKEDENGTVIKIN